MNKLITQYQLIFLLSLGYTTAITAMMISSNPRFTLEAIRYAKKLELFNQAIDIYLTHNKSLKHIFFTQPEDYLEFRLVCKKFAQSNNMPTKLYDTYNNKDKYISKTCAFIDCVNRNDIQSTEWLLKNDFFTPLSFLTDCDSRTFYFLSPITLVEDKIKNGNDETKKQYTPMITLLKNHHIKRVKNDNDFINEKERSFNYKLCLAACVGDIDAFKKEYIRIDKHIDEQKQKNKKSIPLVIWAATKNCDIEFLKTLKTYPEYQKYMYWQSDKFLRFAFVGDAFELYFSGPHAKDIIISPEHFERIKKLIDSEVFCILTRNHDCQFTWNNHAVGYLEMSIKLGNIPAFKDMHTYAANAFCRIHKKEYDKKNTPIKIAFHWLCNIF